MAARRARMKGYDRWVASGLVPQMPGTVIEGGTATGQIPFGLVADRPVEARGSKPGGL